MFRAAHRSSSGALNRVCSLWFIYLSLQVLLNQVAAFVLLFQSLLKAQRVSSGTPLIIRSSKLCLQPLVYVPMWWLATGTQPWQRPVTTWVYKPEAANTVWSSWWWAVWRSKHVEPSIHFGVINSITKLHLVGYFYWFILRGMDPWILTSQKDLYKILMSVSAMNYCTINQIGKLNYQNTTVTAYHCTFCTKT